MDEPTRQLIDDLKAYEAAFLQHTVPGPNDEMLQRLRKLLFRVNMPDSYLSEKKGKLERAAATWFSPRKWMTHPGGQSVLRVDVLGNIKAVIQQIEFLTRPK